MSVPGLRGLSPGGFVRELVREARQSRLLDAAAQLAFNALLAVFPFAIFLVTVVGFLPIDGVDDEIISMLHEVMPDEAASLFDATIQGVVKVPNRVLLVASLVGSVWAASGGVAALSSALNRAYGAHETRGWVAVRLRAIVITLAASL